MSIEREKVTLPFFLFSLPFHQPDDRPQTHLPLFLSFFFFSFFRFFSFVPPGGKIIKIISSSPLFSPLFFSPFFFFTFPITRRGISLLVFLFLFCPPPPSLFSRQKLRWSRLGNHDLLFSLFFFFLPFFSCAGRGRIIVSATKGLNLSASFSFSSFPFLSFSCYILAIDRDEKKGRGGWKSPPSLFSSFPLLSDSRDEK